MLHKKHDHASGTLESLDPRLGRRVLHIGATRTDSKAFEVKSDVEAGHGRAKSGVRLRGGALQ